jgi:VWFA-related protein
MLTALLLALAIGVFSQTPRPTATPEGVEKVATEEIKLNVLAFDQNDSFVADLTPEDLVISEDGRLHQPTSVRRIPANVLLLLDVGNEISYAKRNRDTAGTARSLVSALHPDDSVAVIQYADRVEVLSDWTRDRARLAEALKEQNLGFGARSVFDYAMYKAIEFFDKTPLENRHLILIGDGVDSFNDEKARSAMLRRLLSSDINVHIVSYTKLQQESISEALKTKPTPPRNNLPPGAAPPHGGLSNQVPLYSINLDRAMVRKRKEQINRLKKSEAFLAGVAEDTNGEIFLPETTEEMVEKTVVLARNIDSQYVVTYTPKRPLSEAKDGETRLIEVTSRRAGVVAQGHRKFIVAKQ